MLQDDINNIMRLKFTNGMLLEAEKATVEFQQLLMDLRLSGMSDEAIRRRVLQDFALENPRYFGSFKNGMRDLIGEAMGQSYQAGVKSEYDALGAEQTYRWTTVDDGSSCDDCLNRAGEIETMEYWQTVGMPKSGFSVCGLNCRCEITPQEVNAPDRLQLEAA
jgi:hypothetical protein